MPNLLERRGQATLSINICYRIYYWNIYMREKKSQIVYSNEGNGLLFYWGDNDELVVKFSTS